MSLTKLLNRPCTIVRRSASDDLDDYGNVVPEETEVETVCELQQRRRDEPDDQGELSDTDWLLILPGGTVISTGDVVAIEGYEYEVVGDPWAARNPRTEAQSHVEASLRLTQGSFEEGGS